MKDRLNSHTNEKQHNDIQTNEINIYNEIGMTLRLYNNRKTTFVAKNSTMSCIARHQGFDLGFNLARETFSRWRSWPWWIQDVGLYHLQRRPVAQQGELLVMTRIGHVVLCFTSPGPGLVVVVGCGWQRPNPISTPYPFPFPLPLPLTPYPFKTRGRGKGKG